MSVREVLKAPNLTKAPKGRGRVNHTSDSHESGNRPGLARRTGNHADSAPGSKKCNPKGQSVVASEVTFDCIVDDVNGENNYAKICMLRSEQSLFNPKLDLAGPSEQILPVTSCCVI